MYFRVKQCRIYNGDHEVFPIHTLVDNEQCLDSRIDAKLLSIHRTITLQYKTFRFTGLAEADQMQNINCTLALEKSEVADGAAVEAIPDCICHNVEDCDQYNTPEPTTTTTSTAAPTIKTPEDEKLEELQTSASRMRGQFHQNSFTIMTNRFDEDTQSTKREICNGIRVDYQHILTRKECCEKNIKLLSAETEWVVPFNRVKKDPCSNVDVSILKKCRICSPADCNPLKENCITDFCTDFPVDCPDMSLSLCEPEASGSNNCFIVHELFPEETANEMCEGAEPNPECWTFAYSRDTSTSEKAAMLTPCMVPMEEKTECSGGLCIDIAEAYVDTFKEKNYVVPMGASIVCQAKGQTFLRGINTEAVTLRTLQTQRSSKNAFT